MSIMRMRQAGDRQQNCSRRARRGGSRRISPNCQNYCARKSTVWIALYSHGEYWHEGTGFAVSKEGGESGAAASEGRAIPNVQQWLVPTQTRCCLGNLARASLSVMQAASRKPAMA